MSWQSQLQRVLETAAPDGVRTVPSTAEAAERARSGEPAGVSGDHESIETDESEPAAVLTVDGVSKQYGETRVFDDLSLAVEDGEFVCLLGPSGCGKTTLLHMIAGIAQPTSGEVRALGNPVEGPDYRLGVVFQQPLLYPWLTVRQNVDLGPRLRGRNPDETRVRELLSLVGLEGVADARPARLSGGMAQRASLARTLANDPEVLLFDEPFSALDELTKRELQAEISRIVEDLGLTAVFVTHDVGEAVYLGDRVVVLGEEGTGIAGTEHVAGAGRPSDDPDSLSHRRRIVELLGVET